MRKRIVNQDPQHVAPVDQGWLDLQGLTQVELTSEDAAYPIEAALIASAGSGWRAAQAGEQTICLLFDDLKRQPLPSIRRQGEDTLAYQGGGIQAVECVATASKTTCALCACDRIAASQRAHIAMVPC